jgi:hypothetical protein
MPTPPRPSRSNGTLIRGITVAAGLVGMLAGFDFGNRLSGMLIGALMALNGAIFCSILAAAVAERLLGARHNATRAPEGTQRDDA